MSLDKKLTTLKSRESLEMSWEEKSGDGRMRPYEGFKIQSQYVDRFDVFVYAGRGNYDGGDKKVDAINLKVTLALIEQWCPNLYKQEMK